MKVALGTTVLDRGLKNGGKLDGIGICVQASLACFNKILTPFEEICSCQMAFDTCQKVLSL